LKQGIYKISIVLVVCIYVFSTIGISVFSHYCGDELEKVSFFTKTNSCCGDDESDEAMESGCCKDELTHIAFKEDFTFYTLIKDCKAPVNALFNIIIGFSDPALQNKSIAYTTSKWFHPPDLVQDHLVACSVIRI
jgi:hypothetical protein